MKGHTEISDEEDDEREKCVRIQKKYEGFNSIHVLASCFF